MNTELLVNGRQLFPVLSEALNLGVIALDKNHKICFWNSWCEHKSGLDATRVLGVDVFTLFPQIVEQNKDHFIKDCLQRQKPAFLSSYFHKQLLPLTVNSPQGTVDMQQNVKIFPTSLRDDQPGCLIIIEDITEQLSHEKEIIQLNLVLRGIRNINQLITCSPTTAELRQQSCHILTQDMFYPVAVFLVANQSGVRFESFAFADPKLTDATLFCPHELFSFLEDEINEMTGLKVFYRHDLPPALQDGMCRQSLKLLVIFSIRGIPQEKNLLCIFGHDAFKFSESELELLREMAEDLSYCLQGITEQKLRQQVEAEKSALQEQVRQAEKMQAVGTLAGGIAHDFNNILAVIVGFSEMLKMNMEKPENLDDVDKILLAADRAKNLVQQILTFSRKDLLVKKSIRPYPVVMETIKMLRATIPSTVIFEPKITDSGDSILVDATRLQQIIMNLCNNAVQVMADEKGLLQVTFDRTVLHKKDIQDKPEVKAGAFFRLTVKDNGQGMDKETQGRIFEPFYTTKEVGKGTGMGLAVSHGIVSDLGGFISVDSKPGEGSTFTVYFPEHEAFAEKNIQKHFRLASAANKDKRILVVDDEASLTTFLERSLKLVGYTVVAKNCSCEALTSFEEKPESFDLLITDQSMPKMSGAELARGVLEIRPDFPIILCTGNSNILSKEKAEEIGIKKYLEKPYNRQEMVCLVRELIG